MKKFCSVLHKTNHYKAQRRSTRKHNGMKINGSTCITKDILSVRLSTWNLECCCYYVFSTDSGVCFVGDTDKKRFGHVMEGEGHQPDSDSETSYDQVHTGGCLFVASCPTQEYFPSMKTKFRPMLSTCSHWAGRDLIVPHYGWGGEPSYDQVQIEWGMSLCDGDFLVWNFIDKNTAILSQFLPFMWLNSVKLSKQTWYELWIMICCSWYPVIVTEHRLYWSFSFSVYSSLIRTPTTPAAVTLTTRAWQALSLRSTKDKSNWPGITWPPCGNCPHLSTTLW